MAEQRLERKVRVGGKSGAVAARTVASCGRCVASVSLEGIVEEVIGGQKTVQGYEAMMMAVASSSFAEKVVVVGVFCGVHGSECKIER